MTGKSLPSAKIMQAQSPGSALRCSIPGENRNFYPGKKTSFSRLAYRQATPSGMDLELKKYAPSPELAPYIRFYYTIEAGKGGPSIVRDNHPQGALDLLFTLKGQVTYSRPGFTSEPLSNIFLMSQQEQHFRVSFGPNLQLVGITFTAEGFAKVFRIPLKGLGNQGTIIEPLLKKQDRELLERLAELPDDSLRIQLLDDYFIRKLYLNDLKFDAVDAAIRKIRSAGGQPDIASLAEEFNLSTRTLQRKFAERMGISPKTYARVIRFNKVLLLLQEFPEADWQDILYHCGYFDQMHLIREFKKFTGMTPEKYRQDQDRLGDFFLSSDDG